MTDKPTLCTVCNRDPARMNSAFAECSHVDCPHRRKQWSKRLEPTMRSPWSKNTSADPTPLDRVYRKAKNK